MQKGKINVQTENIFPIIKKFLYSDHDIFLRELISNAVDATQKLRVLSSMGKFNDDPGDLTIRVKLDKENKTLSIIDRGIGMTAEEVDKYINQIAFSGAEEFVKKFMGKSEDDKKQIIGHFGLGFYSSFMVSSKVDIFSKTYKKGGATKAVHWSCDGSPDYQMEETDRQDRGTEIVLHIAEDSSEYLEEQRILEILNKYCRFLPVEIEFGTEKFYETDKDEEGKDKSVEKQRPRIINNTQPAWIQKPAELKPENYLAFYRELYPMNFEEPLFHIHLNVDYPFRLTGILYFPRVKKHFEAQRDKIQLYCNQVFVTDSVDGIVPDFLTLLHGVIDSPDIPLNVSRSYLQNDPNVRKISSHIAKKVADKLEEIFKDNREEFEKKWDDIRVFIQFGMISDEKFYERASRFCLLKNTEGKYFTLEEYRTHIEKTQTAKDGRLVYLYTSDAVEQHAFVEAARERGYDVLVMDGVLDAHFINMLESKFENSGFSRVDSSTPDKLIPQEDTAPSKLSDEEKDKLKQIFEKLIPAETWHLSFEPLGVADLPLMITRNEFMRRMKDMAALSSGGGFMGELPDSYDMVVNTSHDKIAALPGMEDEGKRDELILQMFDIARLSVNLLKGEDLTRFIRRSASLL
jgi:molecular chaperone HtpG